MKMACYNELTLQDKLYLEVMSQYEGFRVLKKLMEDLCSQATAAVIKLDPTVDQYPRKLQALQHEARAINDFSATLLKSVFAHSEAAVAEIEERKIVEEAKAAKTPFKGVLVQSNKKEK